MFSNWFLKSFRILFLPVSLIYFAVIWVRNKLYDKNILKSVSFGLPIINIGNLAVGGTGKSPMVEYLIRLLKDKVELATLSRGYKRKTKGYALADENSTALEIGDEPLQFHLKFPEVVVAVGEERVLAIPQLLHDRPQTKCIILDDAFQHRKIKAGLDILLTDYGNLFTRDFYLPAGDLRDLKSGYKRAEIIVITKCKPDLSIDEKNKLTEEIKPLPHQHIFFTVNKYSQPYHILNRKEIKMLSDKDEVLLVTGIANPRPLKELIHQHTKTYYMLHYKDHHIFTIDDFKEIKKRFDKMDTKDKFILTTEKDSMRLMKFKAEMLDLPLYVIPIQHQFLFDEGKKFDGLILKFAGADTE